jgi:hypothetical protein
MLMFTPNCISHHVTERAGPGRNILWILAHG